MAETVGETGEHQLGCCTVVDCLLFVLKARSWVLSSVVACAASCSAGGLSTRQCQLSRLSSPGKQEGRHPTPESLHSFSRPVGFREKGEPWAQSQNLLRQRPCAWPPVCQDTR